MSNVIIAGGQNIGCKILDFISNKTEDKIVCVIARTDDEGGDEVFPSLMKKALQINVPLIKPKNVNAKDVIEYLKEFDADILISAMYNRIFKSDIISLFQNRHGIINIHYAPLPRYSGFWPEMWAIWNEERDFGITFHHIDEGIDTGNILYQKKIDISPQETRVSLYKKCDDAAFYLFSKYYKEFLNQEVRSNKQDERERTYYKRELPNGGILDLSWDKRKIERFIRATTFYPFVGAKIKIGENIYTIVGKDLEFFIPHFIRVEK